MTKLKTDKHTFHLSKWYMDVIAENGELIIVYAALLTWRNLKIGYRGWLCVNEQEEVFTHSHFGQIPTPEIQKENFEWIVPDIQVQAKGIHPATTETLLSSSERFINWHCLQPLAQSQIQLKEQSPVIGLGYNEKLELNFIPWELPIDVLLWGRFLSKEISIVWIKWIGKEPRNLLWVNGQKTEHAIIEENNITYEDYRLEIINPLPLRNGRIDNTVFKTFDYFKKLFPLKAMRMQEEKWRSKGILSKSGQPLTTGWIIHEKVTF